MNNKLNKKIYFLRHGETESNVRGLVQGSDEPLSEVGERQAKFLGQRLLALNFDAIIASSDLRATKTAEIANELLNKPLERSSLFVERRNPSSLIGKEALSPEVKEIYGQIRDHWTDPEWHYEDEESFIDVRNRVNAALDFLLNRNEDNLAVFSHGNFLSVILGVMIFGSNITQETWRAMRQTIELSNTGLTICEYVTNNEEPQKGKWKILTMNDHAHLSDLVDK